MPAERRKLKRLLRLERIRAAARHGAAAEAARAESTLAQVQALAARSATLAADYAGRNDASDGGDLRRLAIFAGGLEAVRTNTLADSARAQALADQRQAELAAAERRRAAAEDRAAATLRALLAAAQQPVLGARRK